LKRQKLNTTKTAWKHLEQVQGIEVNKLQSGPLGCDQQDGAKIAGGEIDLLIFFWDPLTSQPHNSDVRALLRIAVVWNVPVACNRSSADFMITSPLLLNPYQRFSPDYHEYRGRLDADHPVADQ